MAADMGEEIVLRHCQLDPVDGGAGAKDKTPQAPAPAVAAETPPSDRAPGDRPRLQRGPRHPVQPPAGPSRDALTRTPKD